MNQNMAQKYSCYKFVVVQKNNITRVFQMVVNSLVYGWFSQGPWG